MTNITLTEIAKDERSLGGNCPGVHRIEGSEDFAVVGRMADADLYSALGDKVGSREVIAVVPRNVIEQLVELADAPNSPFIPNWKLLPSEKFAVSLTIALAKYVPEWPGATDEQLAEVAAYMQEISDEEDKKDDKATREAIRKFADAFVPRPNSPSRHPKVPQTTDEDCRCYFCGAPGIADVLKICSNCYESRIRGSEPPKSPEGTPTRSPPSCRHRP